MKIIAINFKNRGKIVPLSSGKNVTLFFDRDGIIEVDDEVAKELVSIDNDIEFFDKEIQTSNTVGNEDSAESIHSQQEVEEDNTNAGNESDDIESLKKEIKKMSKVALVELAKNDLKLPEDEWKEMNRNKLIDYIISKL